MAESVGSIYYEVDAKTTGLQAGIQAANDSLDQLQKGFDDADAAQKKFKKSSDDAGAAANKEAQALRRLLGEIDPAVGKLQKLSDQSAQLKRHFDEGRLSA